MKITLYTNEDRNTAKRAINELPVDSVYDVIIEPHVEKRRDVQSRLYWAWLHIIADDTGNDVETIHKEMRHKFIGYKSVEINNETIEVLVSTTSLSVREFSNYLNQIEAWALTELNIKLHRDESR